MILAIETSCDETAAALFSPERGFSGEWVYSQIALHGRYGGVVPDLATREHLRTLGPLLDKVRETQGDFGQISQVAVTRGPGLAGCLAIGTAAAKALALSLKTPLVGVNHLRGHAFSPFIPVHAAEPGAFRNRIQELLPHLGLVVSGGNTLLFRLDEKLSIKTLATTRDDAAGEALDKGAKLLGLGYPGGPLIEKRALSGKVDAYDFPRGLGPRSELDFSFSGLKTSLRYQIERMSEAEVREREADLCASYQQAVVDALVRKAGIALEGQGYRSLGLSGGVANNRTLRSAFEGLARRHRTAFLAAEPRHTGDNAGMIAFAAAFDPGVLRGPVPAVSIFPGLELEQ